MDTCALAVLHDTWPLFPDSSATDCHTIANAPIQHQQQPRATVTCNIVINHHWCKCAQHRQREQLNLLVLCRCPITCWHSCQWRRSPCLVRFDVCEQCRQHMHLGEYLHSCRDYVWYATECNCDTHNTVNTARCCKNGIKWCTITIVPMHHCTTPSIHNEVNRYSSSE